MKWQNTLTRISNWWTGKDMEYPCLAFSLPESGSSLPPGDLNDFWRSEAEEPDLKGLVVQNKKNIKATCYFGDALPVFNPLWGRRGTPMIMAAFLGGQVKFAEDTVWFKPVITDWKKFEMVFNHQNVWLKRYLEYFTLLIKESDGSYLPCLPDFGDAMTCLSLLRGADNLLMDLMENKEAVLEARDKFIQLWQKFHGKFWQLYSAKFPGDNSWLIWAPGKTYACQCDFSTMISPKMFREFVVPEIEAMAQYLDFMIWHLDGPEEIKHLGLLLDLPQIKGIQWVPGAANPPAASNLWLNMLKEIQRRGRKLIVYAQHEEEVKCLLRNLSGEGLFIFGGFTGKTGKEAAEFLKMVSTRSHRK